MTLHQDGRAMVFVKGSLFLNPRHRRFDFSSERLRSTCVTLHPDGRAVVFIKGSPEKLLSFMDPSTVPDDFAQTLQVGLAKKSTKN